MQESNSEEKEMHADEETEKMQKEVHEEPDATPSTAREKSTSCQERCTMFTSHERMLAKICGKDSEEEGFGIEIENFDSSQP